MSLITDPIVMIRDIGKASMPLYIWGGALNFPQIFGVVFFYEYPTSIWICVTCVLTLIIAGRIHRKSHLSRLTSICHVLWLPLVPMIAADLSAVSLDTVYGIWLFYVAATMAISAAMDVWNIWIFVKDRDRKILG